MSLGSPKKVLFVLRFLFFVAATAMVVVEHGPAPLPWQFYLIAGLFLVTNVGILLERAKVLHTDRAAGWIFIFDTIVVCMLIYYLDDRPREYFLAYLLAVFISAVGRSIRTAFVIAFLVSVLYAVLSGVGETKTDWLSFHNLIRFLFLFVVASFVAYLAHGVEASRALRVEAQSRLRAEEETRRRMLEQSREELVRIAGFYEDILQSIQSGVIVTSADGKVILFNRRAEELCRLSSSSIIGKSLREVSALAPFQGIILPPGSSDFRSGRHEIEFTGAEGKAFMLGINTSVLKDPSGRVSGYIGVFQDITLLREYQQQVMQMERLATVGVLTSEIAHEINNPLASIANCAEALMRRIYELTYSPNTDETRQYLKIIYDESYRCKSILDRILGHGRSAPFSAQPTELRPVLEDVILLVKSQPVSTQKRIEFSSVQDLPPVSGNAAQLKQVFLNLLLNSLEAVDRGGRVEVTTALREGEIHIAFTDNGCGIPRENLYKIFDPFFTTKQDGKGTGLGLSISSDIVRRHKGKLLVTSPGAGQGSCFTVVLPGVSEDHGNGDNADENPVR